MIILVYTSILYASIYVPDSEWVSHIEQFDWRISAAFLQGILPATFLFIIYIFMSALIFYLVVMPHFLDPLVHGKHVEKKKPCVRVFYFFLKVAAICSLLGVVCLVNAMYILAQNSDQVFKYITSIQIALCLFNLVWNQGLIPRTIRMLQVQSVPFLHYQPRSFRIIE